MKPIVIGYGLLGSEIVNQTGWPYISRGLNAIDFAIPNTYIQLIENYDIIINCVAITDTYGVNRDSYYLINYKAAADLSDYCKKSNKKLIHISTDYVYAESKNYASELDIPLISKNWYTYYKLLADEYISLRNTEALICRCSFKPNPFPYDQAWINQIGNFDYVDKIASLIIKLIEKDAKGIYNVGTELKNMYDLASRTRNVKPCFFEGDKPANISMNIEKLKNKLNEK